MDYNRIAGIIFVVGFAIQKAIELLDIWISSAAKQLQLKWTNTSEADCKKFLTGIIGFVIGVIVTAVTDIRLLKLINPDWANDTGEKIIDFLLTSLIVPAGVEFSNNATKYFQYVKDAKSADAATKVTIVPDKLEIAILAETQFYAIVDNNDNKQVKWRAVKGTIDSTGKYKAPNTAGTDEIFAISEADPNKVVVAIITIK